MQTKTFCGGIIVPERKDATAHKEIRTIPAPSEVILPLRQHTGAPCEPVVAVGEAVKMGEVIGEAKAYVSAPVHSPVSGKIKAIRNSVNPVYGVGPAIVIENDGKDESVSAAGNENPQNLSKEKLIEIIKKSGIVGLGGAAFPTHVKLNVPKDKFIDTLIANGAECEPYLTTDHRLMVEKINEIIKGIRVSAGMLGVKNIFLAIEENKMDAVLAAKKAAGEPNDKEQIPVKVVILKTKYPQGSEKQLIKAILGRVVPAGKLPMDVGVVVQNVGTFFAIYEAIYKGKPLIERCVTITGSSIREPGNFIVRLGTRLEEIVKYCGGFIKTPAKIIVGGPMMGIAEYSAEFPVIKGLTGVIFLAEEDIVKSRESVCIRCGKCIEVCPMLLMPTTLMSYVKKELFYRAKNLGLASCFECGACAYICPAKIPLLDYMKFGKSKIENL